MFDPRTTVAWWLTGLGVLLTLGGCLSPCHHKASRANQQPTCEPLPRLTPVEPGLLEPVFWQAAHALSPEAGQCFHARPPYQAATELEAQCLAAKASSLGNLLEKEAQAVKDKTPAFSILRNRKEVRQSELRQAILRLRSLEERNRAAGAALELFYRLADGEGRKNLLQASLTDVAEALRKGQEIAWKGLPLPVELDTLRRQQLDFQSELVQIELGLDQGNGELLRLLGLPREPCTLRIWPLPHNIVCEDPIEPEAAVALGMAHRPQIALLRLLEKNLDRATLPAIKQVLGSVNSLLGTTTPRQPFLQMGPLREIFRFFGTVGELSTRGSQMAQFRQESEKSIVEEIRLEARALEERVHLVALARDRARSWQKKVEELEEKQKKGMVSFLEILTPRLEYYRARGELVKEVTAWNIARVKLKQEQGLLVDECGYALDAGGQNQKSRRDRHPCSQPRNSGGVQPTIQLIPSEASPPGHQAPIVWPPAYLTEPEPARQAEGRSSS